MDLPKIYPITPETDIFEKLLTAITGSASNNFSVFQYRRKNLDESRVEEELEKKVEELHEKYLQMVE